MLKVRKRERLLLRRARHEDVVMPIMRAACRKSWGERLSSSTRLLKPYLRLALRFDRRRQRRRSPSHPTQDVAVSAILLGLLPIMWSPVTEAGADVMKRIAMPMIGGIVTSAIMELLIYPVINVLWKKRGLKAGRVIRSFRSLIRSGSPIVRKTSAPVHRFAIENGVLAELCPRRHHGHPVDLLNTMIIGYRQ